MTDLPGEETKAISEPLDLANATLRYRGLYAVVLDPEFEGSEVMGGKVIAVSRTEDGVSRVMRHLIAGERTVTVIRLP